MTKAHMKYIVEHRKWPFSWPDFFLRYYIMFAPIALMCLSFLPFIYATKDDKVWLSNDDPMLLVPLSICAGGFFLGMFTYRRIESERTFRLVPIPPEFEFDDYIYILELLEWRIVKIEDNYIKAKTKHSLFSWGETVTLIFTDREILMNSRPMGSQPFTFNRDLVNYRKLKSAREA
jgi:hypothetical protein